MQHSPRWRHPHTSVVAMTSHDELRTAVSADGARIRYLDAGDPGAPAVLLCHGFPHFHYTWHRQVPALVEAGYRVLAPDMRGCGHSDAPIGPEHYAPSRIVEDLEAVLDDAGVRRTALVGFDFGAGAVYDFCHLRPERAVSVIGFENPFMFSGGSVSPIQGALAMGEKHFLHMAWFIEPGVAEAVLDPVPGEFLARVFYALSADYHYLDVWQHPPSATYLEALPEPPELPWPWLSVEEMQCYEAEFTRTGFAGPLQWYRAMDVSWHERRAFQRRTNPVPFYFVYSDHDPDLEGFHGPDPLGRLDRFHDDVRMVRSVGRAGHLMHLEATEELNRELLVCLADAYGGDGRVGSDLDLDRDRARARDLNRDRDLDHSN